MIPALSCSDAWSTRSHTLLVLLLLMAVVATPCSAQFARNDDPFNENIRFNQGGANTFNSDSFYGGGLGSRGGNGFVQPDFNARLRGRGRRMLQQAAASPETYHHSATLNLFGSEPTAGL